MATLPVLGYWDIRGLAQPIRLLLEYTGTEFEDRHFHVGPPPTCDRCEWTNTKYILGLDFPNLPYFIDGEHRLTQSNAILRYLARKHDLLGNTEEERIRVDIIAEEAMDFKMGFSRLAYSQQFKELLPEYLITLGKKLDEFSRFLGAHPWFAGDSLTFVDFSMYEWLELARILAPEVVNKFGPIVEFLERFEQLPQIEAFMKSDRFQRLPFYLNNAVFNPK